MFISCSIWDEECWSDFSKSSGQMLCSCMTSDWSLCEWPQNWKTLGYYRKENLNDERKNMENQSVMNKLLLLCEYVIKKVSSLIMSILKGNLI